MELNEFLEQESEILAKKEQLHKEEHLLNKKLDLLYDDAPKNGIFWQSTEKKWFKE